MFPLKRAMKGLQIRITRQQDDLGQGHGGAPQIALGMNELNAFDIGTGRHPHESPHLPVQDRGRHAEAGRKVAGARCLGTLETPQDVRIHMSEQAITRSGSHDTFLVQGRHPVPILVS